MDIVYFQEMSYVKIGVRTIFNFFRWFDTNVLFEHEKNDGLPAWLPMDINMDCLI